MSRHVAGRHVALLRAVNLGGASIVRMADLRAAAEAMGLAEVATVLQSGNLVFAAAAQGPALESLLETGLRDRLGLATQVMVRSAGQWREALAGNPFVATARADPSHLVLMTLKAPAAPGAKAALQAAIRGHEQILVAGDMAYIAFPDGIGRSKLTMAVLQRHFGTAATGRNWTTAHKIAAQLGA